MTDMNKMNEEALESVVGGATRRVHNDALSYANVRNAPGLDTDVIGRVYNGDTVQTTGRRYKKDGYVWYEFEMGAAGHPTAWIAGSLIGY